MANALRQLGRTDQAKLAEDALELIAPHFGGLSDHWTAGVALPGGDFPVDGVAQLIARLKADYDFLDESWAARLIRAYGTDAWAMMGAAPWSRRSLVMVRLFLAAPCSGVRSPS